jgi:hypothetical protein
VVPIDHGLAFPTRNQSQGSSLNYLFDKEIRLNQAETRMLSSFAANREQIARDLSEHLEPEAIEAMFQRVEVMLKKGRTDNGWRKPTIMGLGSDPNYPRG